MGYGQLDSNVQSPTAVGRSGCSAVNTAEWNDVMDAGSAWYADGEGQLHKHETPIRPKTK